MIVCITGDVHHPLSSNWWDRNEVRFAEEYVEIINSFKVKATLFITGKCIKNNKKTFKSISRNYDNIEFGGHTYYAFKILPYIPPKYFAALSKLIIGSSYGPKFWQKMDIAKTVNAFKEIGINIKVWRTHSYAGDKITYSILNNLGITVVSDKRRLCNFKIKKEIGNLYHLYITMPMDELITPDSYEDNQEWIESMWKIINCEIRKKANIVFNLHPKRMKMLDDFETFEDIIKVLKRAKYKFFTVSDVISESKNEELF